MPFFAPSATSTTTTTSPAPPTRPGHRRSYTSERGPGAFAPLAALPRRTSAKFQLHDNSNSNSSDESEDENAPPPIKFRGGGLKLNTTSIPFPRTSPNASPLPSPRSQTPSLAPPRRPLPHRTSSSPILLSNGKPLKSSLKSSASASSIVNLPHLHSLHMRAQSAPEAPPLELQSPGSEYSFNSALSTPKSVHFPESQLESVRLFSRLAKPASLLSGQDTETETEAPASMGYPFPITPAPVSFTAQVDTVPSPTPAAEVIVESADFDKMSLTGTILVRNVSFEKHVAVRFTLDDWQTTSEVSARYAASLPSLPPSIKAVTLGDIAAGVVPQPWDRFSYHIRLEDYASSLGSRTLYFVVRYNAAGGEWWDNNGHKNYRVAFVKKSTSPPATASSTVPFPSVTETPATPPLTPPEAQNRARSASIEKRLRGFSLANYAKPSPTLTPPLPRKIDTAVHIEHIEETPALSHSSSESESEDEAPSPYVERPRKDSPASLPAFNMNMKAAMVPLPSSPQVQSPTVESPLQRSSPPSSSDDLYKAFVQKWCFVGGVGA